MEEGLLPVLHSFRSTWSQCQLLRSTKAICPHWTAVSKDFQLQSFQSSVSGEDTPRTALPTPWRKISKKLLEDSVPVGHLCDWHSGIYSMAERLHPRLLRQSKLLLLLIYRIPIVLKSFLFLISHSLQPQSLALIIIVYIALQPCKLLCGFSPLPGFKWFLKGSGKVIQ